MERGTAGLVAALAAVSLLAQGLASHAEMGGPGPAAVVWAMAGYFTVLTNALVALAFALIAAGRPPGRQVLGGLILSILAVGAVYHLLLARLRAPQGLAWWADLGLHAAVPLAVLGWWLAFGARRPFAATDPLLWLLWPLAYAAAALVRGLNTGFWPYPFLDLPALGWAGLIGALAPLAAGFLAGGYLLVALSRLRVRPRG